MAVTLIEMSLETNNTYYTLFLLSSYDLEYSAFVLKSTGYITVNRDKNLNVN